MAEYTRKRVLNMVATAHKLRGADLSGLDLSEAKLRGADLRQADLSGADLSGANLLGTNLSQANLIRAYLDDTTQINDKWRLVWEIVNVGAAGRNLPEDELCVAFWGEADLTRADLRRADLYGANLDRKSVV
jgi:uncharacterized protein YjbI with pentapeptide repeats